jgi:hypothetical protein
MTRGLINLLTVLSVLLCAAAVVLWVRGHIVEDRLVWRNVNGARWVSSAPGHLVIGFELANWSAWPTNGHGVHYESGPPQPVAEHVARMLVLSIGPRDTFEQRQGMGFGWYRWRPVSRASHFARLVVPLWAVVVVTGALPLWRAVRTRLRPRRRSGLCHACGYDLRATPDKCPECGALAAAGGGT